MSATKRRLMAASAVALVTAGAVFGGYQWGSDSTADPTASVAPTTTAVTTTTTAATTASSIPRITASAGAVLSGAVHLPFDPAATFSPLPDPKPTLWVKAGATGGDGSQDRPFGAIKDAVSAAQPGDTVMVQAGEYREELQSVRAGEKDRLIRFVSQGAKLVGPGLDTGRLVEIDHDYITLEGFDLSNADKLIWIQQARGVRILRNTVHGAGGECVRIKYFSSFNELANNSISDCGRVNFTYPDGNHKNGEGIYMGTAPEQVSKNPTDAPDTTNFNWVHDNVVRPRAECVDIKEASTGNIVQANDCSGQLDPDGSAFDSRGNGNFFIGNYAKQITGAGVRVGGDKKSDGADNVVVGNTLLETGGYALKLENAQQQLVCGNQIGSNAAGSATRSKGKPIYDPTVPCH
jgi:hypothetical protein